MKKRAAILGLILILVMVFAPVSHAAGLSIADVTPKDGESGKQPQNMAVKVKFSEKMDDRSANESKFKITDPEGTELAFQMVYSEKYPDELWVVLNENLQPNTEYKFSAASGITSAAGNVMDSDFVSVFKTRNTKTDSAISMLLMVGMMAIMFVSTSKATKKQAEQQAAASGASIRKQENLNPYKIAKEKGISLEEATAYVEKEKAKQAKQIERIERERAKKEEELAVQMAEVQARLEAEEEAARRANNFRVKAPGSVAAKGLPVPKSVIRKNRKKREAARAAEKAAAKAKKK